MDIRCKGCGGPTRQETVPTGPRGAWQANKCMGTCKDPSGRYVLHTPAPKAPYQAPYSQNVPQPCQNVPQKPSEAIKLLKENSAKLDKIIHLLTDSLEKEHRKQQDIQRFEGTPQGTEEKLDLPDEPLDKEPF